MKINITDFEKIVLSSFLFDPSLFDEFMYFLQVEDFYDISHQEFYKTLHKLYEMEYPFDEMFIIKNADGRFLTEQKIIEIMTVNSMSNVSSYVNEIKESSNKRKLEKLSQEIKKNILDDNLDSDSMISYINTYLLNLDNSKNIYEHTSKELIEKIKYDMENRSNLIKHKFHTGITSLDKILTGIDDGELVVIAARPSMGKTSLISSICIETLEKGHGVLIESLEMDANNIMKRLIATKSEEPLKNIKEGRVENLEKFNDSLAFLSSEDLIIEDESYVGLYQLQTKIKRVLRKNKNIKNIFIDHTGKIKLPGKTREDIEIGYITNTLKKIAREHNIRVFLLQQLNRTVETRDNKRPILSDLKNSGNIEEDADIVLGLYRGSYYKSKEESVYENDFEEAEIIVLKNRNGRLGTAKVWFEKNTSSFRNKTVFDTKDLIVFE